MSPSTPPDGQYDTATLTARVLDFSTVTWQVAVTDESGNQIRLSPPGTGSSISWEWDGRKTEGTVAPDDTYTLVLTVVDGAGNAVSSPDLNVRVDTQGPTLSGLAARRT